MPLTPEPRKPGSELTLVQLLPNFLTVAGLCAGLTAIRFAVQGQFSYAIGLIILAAVLDGLDGRLARMLKSESEIGAELDSLADFVNFGVAPGMTIYLWALQDSRGAGWIAVLIYVICCVLRLARFNVGNRPSPERAMEKQDKSHFVGVPSPAGALLVMFPMYLAFTLPSLMPMPELPVALYVVAIGALMISRIPTPSFKTTTVYAENVKFIVLAFVALIAALLTYPWVTLVALTLAYGAALLFACRKPRRAARKDI